MPKLVRSIVLALILAAAAAAVVGCGSNGPSPSISAQEAAVLTSKIDEIRANVDVGSCLVAADKTDDLIADINNLSSSVNSDVRRALNSGANKLKLLLEDPDKCESRAATTTSTPSTTTPSTTQETTTRSQPTTTTRTQTQPTTTSQTQTAPTTTGASGGIGPGGL